MQALNVQILNPQEHEISRRAVSPQKQEAKAQEHSFSEMVESASKEAGKKTVKAKVPSAECVPAEELAEAVQPECAAEVTAAVQPVPVQYVPVQQAPLPFQEPVSCEESGIILIENEDFVQESVLLEISSEQLSYLHSAVPEAAAPLSGDGQLPSAGEDELLLAAQSSSVESPGRFLNDALLPDDLPLDTQLPAQAADTALAAEPAFSSAERKEQKAQFFSLEFTGRGAESPKDAPSLFESLFTVTDERSIEQKIADFKSEMNIGSENQDSSINLAMTLSENARQNILSENSQSAGATGSAFQQMLAQQVQVNAPDFARAGSIILRDNDSGSINMILKPESLGNVKINLQLSDNGITGQITVSSKEAFEAFRQNLDTLRQAFQDSGFENASLNLSFADTSSGRFSNGERQHSDGQFLSGQAYGKYAASGQQDAGSAAEAALYEGISDRKVSVII